MNDQILKTILSKLDAIEGKIKMLEGSDTPVTSTPPQNDLYTRTLRFMEKNDEITSSMLEKELGIDRKRADMLLDQLEQAGYGRCYTEEV